MINIKSYFSTLNKVQDIRGWDHNLHDNSENDWICFDRARKDPAFKNRYHQSCVIDIMKICRKRGELDFLFIELKDLRVVSRLNDFFEKKRDNLALKIIESIGILSFFLASSRYVDVKKFLTSKKTYYIVYNGGNRFHNHMGAIAFLSGPRLKCHVTKVAVMEWSIFCKVVSPTYCK